MTLGLHHFHAPQNMQGYGLAVCEVSRCWPTMLAGSRFSDSRTLCLSRQQPGRMPDLGILTRAMDIHMRYIIRLCHVSTHL